MAGGGPRDAHRLLAPGVVESKDRVCIVVRAEADWVLAVDGQGECGIGRRVPVDPDSFDGRELELTKTTYFRSDSLRWYRADKLRGFVCKVSYDLWLDLDDMVSDRIAKKALAAHPPGATKASTRPSVATNEGIDDLATGVGNAPARDSPGGEGTASE